MVTNADLHRLIDRLPEAAVPEAERLLATLERDAAPYVPLHEAPPDEADEDELEALAEARADHAAGAPRKTHEELKRELGL